MEEAFLHPMAGADVSADKAYWIRTDDGLRLRIAIWRHQTSINGSILMFPGRTDYIEQYAFNMGEFRKRGYSSIIIDWRGHGLSDRISSNPRLGHVHHFSDYQRDVAAMVRAANELQLPKPWYLVAHSMGGCIGLRSLMNGLPVTGSAFTAPMWGIHLPAIVRKVALPIAFGAQAIGLSQAYAPGHSGDISVLKGSFDRNTMTGDALRYDYLVNLAKNFPDALTGGPSMGWLYQALSEIRKLAVCPSPNIPCITFSAETEVTVDGNAIVDRMSRWANGHLVTIPNARHELFMEVPAIRDVIFDEICSSFRSFNVSHAAQRQRQLGSDAEV